MLGNSSSRSMTVALTVRSEKLKGRKSGTGDSLGIVSLLKCLSLANWFRRTLAMLVPILEEVAGWQPPEIQEFFEGNGFLVREWARARTDWLTLRSAKSERADAATI